MYCNIEKEEMRVKRIEKVDKNCRRNKMFPVYEQKKENVHILQKTSRHAPPHLHNSVNRVFKDRFRMTPREYRKRFRE